MNTKTQIRTPIVNVPIKIFLWLRVSRTATAVLRLSLIKKVLKSIKLLTWKGYFGFEKIMINSVFQVSVEEWASMWDDYSKRPENALEWQTQYMRFMFELEDASGDGSIDVDEFASVCSCYGLETGECREAFAKMSQVTSFFQH